MIIWNKYTSHIKEIFKISNEPKDDVVYWSNNLFAEIIIYILPFCSIALLPSLYFLIFVIHQIPIAIVDLLSVSAIILIAFLPPLSINVRKNIFIFSVYAFSSILLYFVGFNGTGLIYMQVVSVFFILIYPNKNPYWPVIFNSVIVLFFALLISLKAIPWANKIEHSLGAWFAVSSNIIFLTLLECTLIPKLIIGLQHTIEQEKRLQNELSKQQQSLKETLHLLNRKNEELEQFAYVASHDLQEPLRMVSNFVSQLHEKYIKHLDEKANQYIGFALEGTKKMRQTILDLLNFSIVGRYDDEKENINLNTLLSEIENSLQNVIAEKNAVIIYNNLPQITTYRIAISQVLMNLISNSIKYNIKGVQPTIHINCEEQESHFLFSIKDNGIGIEEEYFEKVFIIFQRLQIDKNESGTGIGLAVVKKIIENLGGKVWLTSEKNAGTTFYFTIPKNN
jgi:signal transduction histidine kinase